MKKFIPEKRLYTLTLSATLAFFLTIISGCTHLHRNQASNSRLTMSAEELKQIPVRKIAIKPDQIELPADISESTGNLFIVLDTSGSMRSRSNAALYPQVIKSIQTLLTSFKDLYRIIVLDANGRIMLIAFSDKPLAQDSIIETQCKVEKFQAYTSDTKSSPINGLLRALMTLENDAKMRADPTALFVVADSFDDNEESLEEIERRINELKMSCKLSLSCIDFSVLGTNHSKPSNSFEKYRVAMSLLTSTSGGVYLHFDE